MSRVPGWTPFDVPTEPQDGRQGEAAPAQGLPLDARLCAWILGLTLAALIVLCFGDALAGWAGVR